MSHTASASPRSARAGSRQWVGLAVLALPTLLLSADTTVLYLATPHLAGELSPSGSQMLWITDVYGFLIAGFLIPMGSLGDRIGRRRLLIAGAAAFLIGSAVAAYAPSAETLILARGLLGVAGATLMPSTLALLSTMFEDRRQRGMAIGVWAACLSGGVAIGPVLGGALLSAFWWGSVFLIGVPVMAALLATAPFLLPEHRATGSSRIDPPSVVLALAATLTTVYALKRLAEHASPTYVGLALLGLAIAVAFVHRQRHVEHPLVDLELFRRPAFGAALTLLLLGLAAVGGTYLFVTLYLQQALGLSPLTAGLWLVPAAVAMIVTSVTAPYLTRGAPTGPVVAGALTVSVLGFGLLAMVRHDSPFALVIVGITVVYVGQGPLMALGTDLIVSSARPEQAGAASSLSETSGELGLALGVAMLGSLGLAAYRRSMPGPGNGDTSALVTEAGARWEPVAAALAGGLNVVALVAGGLTACGAVIAVRISRSART